MDEKELELFAQHVIHGRSDVDLERKVAEYIESFDTYEKREKSLNAVLDKMKEDRDEIDSEKVEIKMPSGHVLKAESSRSLWLKFKMRYPKTLKYVGYAINKVGRKMSDNLLANAVDDENILKKKAITITVANNVSPKNRKQAKEVLLQYINLEDKNPNQSVYGICEEIDDGTLSYTNFNEWVEKYKKNLNTLQ